MNQCQRLAEETSEQPRAIISRVQKNLPTSSAIDLQRPECLSQIIKRSRDQFVGRGNFKTRKDIEIPEELQRSNDSDYLFLWDDSGHDDENRILIFSTKLNIKILNDPFEWYLGFNSFIYRV